MEHGQKRRIMKLPFRLIAIAVIALAFMFAYSPPQTAAADIGESVQVKAQADTSGTVASTAVDANTVASVECQALTAWTRRSVGKPILNVTPRIFAAVEELDGYRTVPQKPKITTYTGFANTRAREKVQS
jgi:hypothetical protein